MSGYIKLRCKVSNQVIYCYESTTSSNRDGKFQTKMYNYDIWVEVFKSLEWDTLIRPQSWCLWVVYKLTPNVT